MSPRRFAALAAASVALGLSACGVVPPEDRLGYRAPTATAVPAVAIGAPTRADAVARAAAALRGGGLTVTATDPARGRVAARARDAGLVDCGTFYQRAFGNVSEFPGAAPLAVVFSDSQPGGVFRREARVDSRVDLAVDAGTARIDERHRVTLRHLSADGKRLLWSETRSVTGAGRAAFADGTVCVSSGRVAALLR